MGLTVAALRSGRCLLHGQTPTNGGAASKIPIHFLSFALIVFMTPEDKLLPGEMKMKTKQIRNGNIHALYSISRYIFLCGCYKKRPKYTSVGDNSSNKTPKIENVQTDVPRCPD